MKNQKLVLVSMDALIYEDLEYLKTLPSFSGLMEKAAMVKRVRSIYPTLTYPCHATMATGCYPAKHGIINNTFMQPGVKDSPWLWYHDAYRVQDIIDAAHEKGLTTAAVGWPTMGRHQNLDWIVGEIAHTSAKTEEEFRRDYLLTGTTAELWEQAGAPNIHWRTEQKCVAKFNARACCEIIRRYSPDLTLLHVAGPDNYRHKYGVFSDHIKEALDECELILSWLLDAIRDTGVEERFNLVITADHGQMNTVKMVSPNVLLREGGFIDVDQEGEVCGWRAWSHSVGMCTEVFVKDPADEEKVYAYLKQHQGKGYTQVYTRGETAQLGFDGPFAFVLETDGETHYGNEWQGEYLVRHEVKGSHGHHPDKGPRPPILAAGPAFRTGAVLENADLADGAPTWARALGFELPEAQGRVIEEILNGLR